MDSQNKDSNAGGAPEPSGPKGDSPATSGQGKTQIESPTPENRKSTIDPSAPNDAITAPSEQALERPNKDNNPV